MAERFRSTRDIGTSLNEWGGFLTSSTGEGPLEPNDMPAGELIRGELDRTQLDLITIDAEHHVVDRTPEHVARTPKRHIFSVLLSGTSSIRLSDRSQPVVLSTGDVGYWTSELPYRWEFDGPFTLLTLRVPYQGVDIDPSTLRPLIGTSFASDRGLAKYLVPFVEQVLSDPSLLGNQNGTRIVQDLVSLFTTMLVGEIDLSTPSERSRPSFLRVTEYISTHLPEALDLRRIARANDMSARYVQSLFQERGTTLSEWIRLRRLESARQALADPVRAAHSIGQIGIESGFADQAHFARTFRTAYGESPTEWRRRALRT